MSPRATRLPSASNHEPPLPRAARPTASGSQPGSIRRNLFHSHLSRRPTSTASSSSTRSTTILDNPFGGPGVDEGPGAGGAGDIVVRNANGEYAVLTPALATAADAKGESDEPGLDDEQREVEGREGPATVS